MYLHSSLPAHICSFICVFISLCLCYFFFSNHKCEWLRQVGGGDRIDSHNRNGYSIGAAKMLLTSKNVKKQKKKKSRSYTYPRYPHRCVFACVHMSFTKSGRVWARASACCHSHSHHKHHYPLLPPAIDLLSLLFAQNFEISPL